MNYFSLLGAAAGFLDITLGNVLTIVATLVAVAMGWQKLSDKLESHDKRMTRVERDLNVLGSHGLPTICAMHSERLQNIETKVDVITGMATDVSWIKAELQRISNHIEDNRRRLS